MFSIKKFKGRFGNQLLLYSTLRERAHFPDNYQCVPWVGQQLFGLNDPKVEGESTIISQYSFHSDGYAKQLFQRLFVPTDIVEAPLYAPIETLREQGHTLIGVHLRRGDYGTFRRYSARWCFVAPCVWYIEWLRANLKRFHKPILVLSSDDIEAVTPEFSEFNTFSMLPGPRYAEYYSDFYALTQCDVMLISNSTFSFTASMLNRRAKEFWRPRLGQAKLIQYDPWDAPIVFKDERYA